MLVTQLDGSQRIDAFLRFEFTPCPLDSLGFPKWAGGSQNAEGIVLSSLFFQVAQGVFDELDIWGE